MTHENAFYNGQIVFDRKRTDIMDDLLVIVNASMGTVDTLDPDTKRLVEENEANQRFGVEDSTEVVSAAYLTHIEEADGKRVSIDSKVYTFPVTRLETITSRSDGALVGYQAYQWALAAFLGELVSAVYTADEPPLSLEQLQVLCMQASIDGEVITKGTELGLGRASRTH